MLCRIELTDNAVYIAAYKTDPATEYEPGADTQEGYNGEFARKGELWSFCSGVLPFLHAAAPAAAVTLLGEVNIKTLADTSKAKWSIIRPLFSAGNLNKMGLKCADVGGFVDKNAAMTSATTLNSDFPVCTDTAQAAPADADSAQCAGDWMLKQVATTDDMTPNAATEKVCLCL